MTERALPDYSPALSRRAATRSAPVVFVSVLALVIGAIGPATAFEVAKGCDTPPPSSKGKNFYIDPQHGSMTNDGSEAKPWRTLAEVTAPQNHLIATQRHSDKSAEAMLPTNTEGPVKPGDTLVLMSGDHGDVTINQYANDAFISVVAGKQQAPLIHTMNVAGSSHWLFQGLKFQGARPADSAPLNWLVNIAGRSNAGPSDNVIFIDNSFSTTDSTESWTDQDWVDKPYLVAFTTSAKCTTFSHNHIYNVRNAIGMGGDNSIIEDNLVERFGNDGMDILSSNLTVRRNLIRDGMHTPADTLHPDGIQGWGNVKNVVIDSNRVIGLTHGMQGISVFDDHWVGVTVTNNLVINTLYAHGITMFGVDDLVIANNTVIRSKPDGVANWIMVAPSKDHRPSSNVVVRNNIASIFTVEDAQCDHNIAEVKFTCKSPDSQPRSDPRLSRNLVDKSIFRSIGYDPSSAGFDPTAKTFDLRPTPGASAYQAGSEQSAPSVDITGRKREAPYDIGAFAR